MNILPLGDSAVLVQVADDGDEQALDRVLVAHRTLQEAKLTGVLELLPAYTSIAVFYDPARIAASSDESAAIFDELAAKIRKILSRPSTSPLIVSRQIDIPVCYDAEFAMDLGTVAKNCGLDPLKVIELHSGAAYRVSCIGFTPGFPYLTGLPRELATPRRPIPRQEVPAGSVAIGGVQTGIYPVKSPGGWHVIGRTPLPLFDHGKDPPTLLSPGDHVRLRAITRDEFFRYTT